MKNNYKKNQYHTPENNRIKQQQLNNEKITEPLLVFWNKLISHLKLMDKWLIVYVILLTFVGLVMTYSATMYFIDKGANAPDPFLYLRNQLFSVSIGWIAILIISLLPPSLFKNIKIMNIVLVLLNILLVVVYVSGNIFGGAQSWLSIFGIFYVQPSEFVKLMTIILMAWIIQHINREVIATQEIPRQLLIFTVANLLLSLALILIQPDLGMVIIIVLTMGLVFFLMWKDSRSNYIIYGGAITGTFFLYLLSYLKGPELVDTEKHQLERLGTFINPFNYYDNAGYQLVQGYITFSQGGWFGRGIGRSLMKRPGGLPAAHTDFMIAIIAEETGVIGASLVVILLFALIIQLFRCAGRSSQPFNMACLTGIGGVLLIQSMINLGGATGLLPLTGVTLPFVSYGGTSMLLTMMLIGVAQNMIIEEKKIRIEHEKNKENRKEHEIDF